MNPKFVSTVKITGHASDRLVQRFKLLLTETERNDITGFIKREFYRSHRDFTLEQCVIKKRKMQQKYGPDMFMVHSPWLTIVGQYVNNVALITSVWMNDRRKEQIKAKMFK